MDTDVALCAFDGAQYLIFNPETPAFVYYSHIPVFLAAILLAWFILIRAKRSLPSWILFFTIIPFVAWVFLDSIFWASNRSDLIMFVWSAIILVEPLIHGGIFYLQYVLINHRDLLFRYKMFAGALFLPLIIFVPTAYTLSDFDISTCLAVESFFALYYSYAVEGVFILLIIATGIRGYLHAPSVARKLEAVYLTIGILAFLLAFTAGNLLGSFTSNWQVGQLGLLGMPIFIVFLGYVIVRFRTFDIKILGAQALVVALWFLLLATLFVRTAENIRLINALTLVLFTLFGLLLVRSVTREVTQREQIEMLVTDLERANNRLRELDQAKSEFVSIASHQMRSPLTAIRGYAEAILDGTFGAISGKIQVSIDHIRDASDAMLKTVNDFLDISRIEQGRMEYVMAVFDICTTLRELVTDLQSEARRKHLHLRFDVSDDMACDVYGDITKIKQVINNIVDNAIKYTPEGEVTVSLEQDQQSEMVRIVITDTGIGLSEEAKRKLFDKFSRSPSAKRINTGGTGLGLYVAKQMIEAHHGRIWAESNGEGEGSTFFVELPMHA